MSMHYIQRHLSTLMPNMQQMSNGLSNLMISSREFLLAILFLNLYITELNFEYKTQNFRYADHPNAYWTGYFTSRPALKGYVRVMSGYYQVKSQASFTL